MNFRVITLFPEMIESAIQYGVVGQAIRDGKVSVSTLSPREFTFNVHHTVDDRPFGGGDGMVMMAEPLAQAIDSLLQKSSDSGEKVDEACSQRIIHFSPRGVPLTDLLVRELSQKSDLILIASRYGGVDQRFLNEKVDLEISVGDYVLSGGELPALILIDAVSRLMPGVLGNEASSAEESFAEGLLEHPQYTRPRVWQGQEVPTALLSGDHAKIALWRREVALFVTLDRRPDLLNKKGWRDQGGWTHKELVQALKRFQGLSDEELRSYGIFSPSQVLAGLNQLANPQTVK